MSRIIVERIAARRAWLGRIAAGVLAILFTSQAHSSPLMERAEAFTDKYCSNCHNDVDQEAGLDLTSLTFAPDRVENFQQWVKVHDRLQAGEMPPKKKQRPDPDELASFLKELNSALTTHEQSIAARQGRASGRRLN